MAEKEYIERDKALEWARLTYCKDCNSYNGVRCGACSFDDAILLIEDYPAADVVEVRHAQFKWGYQNGQYGIWCTICGAGWVDSENAEWIAHEHDYCPKCGAKMDGERKEQK